MASSHLCGHTFFRKPWVLIKILSLKYLFLFLFFITGTDIFWDATIYFFLFCFKFLCRLKFIICLCILIRIVNTSGGPSGAWKRSDSSKAIYDILMFQPDVSSSNSASKPPSSDLISSTNRIGLSASRIMSFYVGPSAWLILNFLILQSSEKSSSIDFCIVKPSP